MTLLGLDIALLLSVPVWFCNFTEDDFEKHTQYVNLTKMSYFLKSAHTAIHLNGNGVNFEARNLRVPY